MLRIRRDEMLTDKYGESIIIRSDQPQKRFRYAVADGFGRILDDKERIAMALRIEGGSTETIKLVLVELEGFDVPYFNKAFLKTAKELDGKVNLVIYKSFRNIGERSACVSRVFSRPLLLKFLDHENKLLAGKKPTLTSPNLIKQINTRLTSPYSHLIDEEKPLVDTDLSNTFDWASIENNKELPSLPISVYAKLDYSLKMKAIRKCTNPEDLHKIKTIETSTSIVNAIDEKLTVLVGNNG